jgi:hypothetical protein
MTIVDSQRKVTTASYVRNMFALDFISGGLGIAVFLLSVVGFFTHVIKRYRRRYWWQYILTAFIALILCFFTLTFLEGLQWLGLARCYSNLSIIGIVLYEYQSKRGSLPVKEGKFDLKDIYALEISGDLSKILICPISGLTKFWKRNLDLGYGETTYKMAEKIELEPQYYVVPPHTPTDKIIMWCPYHGKRGVPVLFTNGNVQHLKWSELRFEHGQVTKDRLKGVRVK